MCYSVGAQIASAARHVLMKPEILLKLEETPLLDKVFHLPFTIVLFTIIALEVLGTSPTLRTDLSYGPAELFLRRRLHGTVFQLGAFHSFPRLITARDLVEDIFST